MKRLNKSLATVFAVATTLGFAGLVFAATAAVGLGTTSSFAILAGTGITNTGATTITGDVGTFPTTTETGWGSVTLHGTNHAGDLVTQGAKNDLVTAYNDAAGRTPTTTLSAGDNQLGGQTLVSGVYAFGHATTANLIGTLTLDGEGHTDAVFIFQASSDLVTASGSVVSFINGASACNAFWQVTSSATLGSGSTFGGTILTLTSATLASSATVQGRILARNGTVTLDTNTITSAACATTLPETSGIPAVSQSSSVNAGVLIILGLVGTFTASALFNRTRRKQTITS